MKTVPIGVIVAVLAAATVARADIDRRRYHELPDGAQRVAGVMTVPAVVARNRPDLVECKTPGSGDYDVYVDADGRGTAIDVVRSIPGCDAYVAHTLLAGRQATKPSDAFVHHVTVELRFEPQAAAGGKPKNVPPHTFDTQAIEREMPHLPDAVIAALSEKHPGGSEIAVTYFVTLGTDGHVTAVDPLTPAPAVDPAITAILKRWRFKPQPVPLRTMLRFSFVIPPLRPPSRR